MNNSFWWDYKISDYLFKGFTSKTVGGLIGLCLCVTSMSFLFEALRYLQAKQRQKELILRSKQLRAICPTESATLLQESVTAPNLRQRAALHGADIGLWFLLQNLGYVLMLSIMLYNGWLFVSALIGGGLGYFIFGQMFMKINLQNCQIIRNSWCMQKCGETETPREGESTPALETSDATVSNCHQVTVECH